MNYPIIAATEVSSSESLWAEHGLTGLVLFALFGLIVLFIRTISTKDKFIKNIIDDERTERAVSRKEHQVTTNRLADAIDGLTQEIRNQQK